MIKSQITVTPQGVTVRTPQSKTTPQVKKMLEERLQWIFKKQLHYAQNKKLEFSTKSGLSILGKEYSVKIIPNSTEKIR